MLHFHLPHLPPADVRGLGWGAVKLNGLEWWAVDFSGRQRIGWRAADFGWPPPPAAGRRPRSCATHGERKPCRTASSRPLGHCSWEHAPIPSERRAMRPPAMARYCAVLSQVDPPPMVSVESKSVAFICRFDQGQLFLLALL